VAEVLLEWTGGQAVAQPATLEDEIEAFVEQYHGTALAQLDLGQMLSDVTTILREHRLALPADLALLIKAFVSLEGMGRGLDPGFHMATEAQPLLRATLRARYQPRALAQRGWEALRETAGTMARLPQDLSNLLRRARHGKVQVGIEIADLRRTGNQIDRAASRLALALVIAALIIGSSIVMTVEGGPSLFGLPAFGLLGFVGAVVGGLMLLRSVWRGRRPPEDDV
jgi:ubiquinone biosynthesis protein